MRELDSMTREATKTPRGTSGAKRASGGPQDLLGASSDVADMGLGLERVLGLLHRLQSKGEERRVSRAPGMQVLGATSEVRDREVVRVSGMVKGDTGVYEARITFQPPGFRCTCPDSRQRGRQVGPCKHVLQLAYVYEGVVDEALGLVRAGVGEILDRGADALKIG